MADVSAVVMIVVFLAIAVYLLRSIRGPQSKMSNHKIKWRQDDSETPAPETTEPAARKPYRASYGAARARTAKRQEDK